MSRKKSNKTSQFKQQCKENKNKKIVDILKGEELKEYKKGLRVEKIKKDEEYRINNPIIDLEIGDKIITIDRTGHEKVATNKELNIYIMDLLEGNFIEPRKKFELTKVSDVLFDLRCDSVNGNNIKMSVC